QKLKAKARMQAERRMGEMMVADSAKAAYTGMLLSPAAQINDLIEGGLLTWDDLNNVSSSFVDYDGDGELFPGVSNELLMIGVFMAVSTDMFDTIESSAIFESIGASEMDVSEPGGGLDVFEGFGGGVFEGGGISGDWGDSAMLAQVEQDSDGKPMKVTTWKLFPGYELYSQEKGMQREFVLKVPEGFYEEKPFEAFEIRGIVHAARLRVFINHLEKVKREKEYFTREMIYFAKKHLEKEKENPELLTILSRLSILDFKPSIEFGEDGYIHHVHTWEQYPGLSLRVVQFGQYRDVSLKVPGGRFTNNKLGAFSAEGKLNARTIKFFKKKLYQLSQAPEIYAAKYEDFLFRKNILELAQKILEENEKDLQLQAQLRSILEQKPTDKAMISEYVMLDNNYHTPSLLMPEQIKALKKAGFIQDYEILAKHSLREVFLALEESEGDMDGDARVIIELYEQDAVKYAVLAIEEGSQDVTVWGIVASRLVGGDVNGVLDDESIKLAVGDPSVKAADLARKHLFNGNWHWKKEGHAQSALKAFKTAVAVLNKKYASLKKDVVGEEIKPFKAWVDFHEMRRQVVDGEVFSVDKIVTIDTYAQMLGKRFPANSPFMIRHSFWLLVSAGKLKEEGEGLYRLVLDEEVDKVMQVTDLKQEILDGEVPDLDGEFTEQEFVDAVRKIYPQLLTSGVRYTFAILLEDGYLEVVEIGKYKLKKEKLTDEAMAAEGESEKHARNEYTLEEKRVVLTRIFEQLSGTYPNQVRVNGQLIISLLDVEASERGGVDPSNPIHGLKAVIAQDIADKKVQGVQSVIFKRLGSSVRLMLLSEKNVDMTFEGKKSFKLVVENYIREKLAELDQAMVAGITERDVTKHLLEVLKQIKALYDYRPGDDPIVGYGIDLDRNEDYIIESGILNFHLERKLVMRMDNDYPDRLSKLSSLMDDFEKVLKMAHYDVKTSHDFGVEEDDFVYFKFEIKRKEVQEVTEDGDEQGDDALEIMPELSDAGAEVERLLDGVKDIDNKLDLMEAAAKLLDIDKQPITETTVYSKVKILGTDLNIVQEDVVPLLTALEVNGVLKPVTNVNGKFQEWRLNHVGGIDLNREHLDLQIKRDADGVPLPVFQQPMDELMHIEGFIPVIINIAPAVNVPMLLGLGDGPQEDDVGQSQDLDPFDRQAYIRLGEVRS
ncbi:hypothetical protein ACFL49_02880, partial [Candidatus Omnitrophota bacterium]